MKHTIIILLSILLIGCKAKTKVVEITKIDTIYKKEIIKIDKPQLNSIVIDNPCDSLGQLKLINYTNTSGNVKTTLKSIHNSLILEVNVDSIVNSRIETFKSSFVGEKIKETIRVKYIPKWVWYLLSINVVYLLFIFRSPILKLLKL